MASVTLGGKDSCVLALGCIAFNSNKSRRSMHSLTCNPTVGIRLNAFGA